MAGPQFIELKSPENTRTYIFPESQTVTFENVVRIAVSSSGTHRLETDDGLKHIVPTGWLAITLNMEEWTF